MICEMITDMIEIEGGVIVCQCGDSAVISVDGLKSPLYLCSKCYNDSRNDNEPEIFQG